MFKTDVLDHGYVDLLQFMTTEEDIVQILSICKGKNFTYRDTDRIIDYVLKHDHSSVFEHIVFRFKVRCPIFVARQWQRHRMGSYTEASLRVNRDELLFYIPDSIDDEAKEIYETAIKNAYDAYRKLLTMKVPAERARGVLPFATYTTFYWTVNMRSLMNFLKLRLDKSAQKEIREYAQTILNMIYPFFRRILAEHADKVREQ